MTFLVACMHPYPGWVLINSKTCKQSIMDEMFTQFTFHSIQNSIPDSASFLRITLIAQSTLYLVPTHTQIHLHLSLSLSLSLSPPLPHSPSSLTLQWRHAGVETHSSLLFPPWGFGWTRCQRCKWSGRPGGAHSAHTSAEETTWTHPREECVCECVVTDTFGML